MTNITKQLEAESGKKSKPIIRCWIFKPDYTQNPWGLSSNEMIELAKDGRILGLIVESIIDNETDYVKADSNGQKNWDLLNPKDQTKAAVRTITKSTGVSMQPSIEKGGGRKTTWEGQEKYIDSSDFHILVDIRDPTSIIAMEIPSSYLGKHNDGINIGLSGMSANKICKILKAKFNMNLETFILCKKEEK